MKTIDEKVIEDNMENEKDLLWLLNYEKEVKNATDTKGPDSDELQ